MKRRADRQSGRPSIHTGWRPVETGSELTWPWCPWCHRCSQQRPTRRSEPAPARRGSASSESSLKLWPPLVKTGGPWWNNRGGNSRSPAYPGSRSFCFLGPGYRGRAPRRVRVATHSLDCIFRHLAGPMRPPRFTHDDIDTNPRVIFPKNPRFPFFSPIVILGGERVLGSKCVKFLVLPANDTRRETSSSRRSSTDSARPRIGNFSCGSGINEPVRVRED
jgi:hypothetical protein